MNNKLGTDRVERLRTAMKAEGIGALISFKPENSFYLSGFNPIIYSHPVIALLPLERPQAILVHALRDDHARASAWVDNIYLYGAWSTKVTQGATWSIALAKMAAELEIEAATIGIEFDFTPLDRFEQLRALLPNAKFVDSSPLIKAARLIKDDAEIEYGRIAAKLADTGMDAALKALADGASERGVSIAAMAAMNQAWLQHFPDIEVADFGSLEGGAQNGLWCWCLTGDRVLINTDNPTLRVPVPGEIATVFIWTNCNGIHSENERSVAIGKLPPERQRAFDAILEIRANLSRLIKPGLKISALYEAAKAEYIRLGYARNVPGRIGHGIGLGAHEAPSLDAQSKVVLAPGMMITFEPNLRIPEWGGLQHSDTLLITEDGFEYLTSTPRGFLQQLVDS